MGWASMAIFAMCPIKSTFWAAYIPAGQSVCAIHDVRCLYSYLLIFFSPSPHSFLPTPLYLLGGISSVNHQGGAREVTGLIGC